MKNATRKFTLAAAATALVGFAGQAQSAPFFIGKMIFTAKSGTCDWDPVGNRTHVRFAPANVGDNGTDSSLSMFDDWGGAGLSLLGGSFNTTLQSVRYYDVWIGAYEQTGAKVKFSSQTPATIAATTPLVNVTGQIQGVIGGQLCTVNFRMSLVRAVN